MNFFDKTLFVLLIISSCAFVLLSCGKSNPKEASGIKEIEIDYRDYSDRELHAVQNKLKDRMEEFGIVSLGIGRDWVSVYVYELTPELESYLVNEIFPEYRSSVVKINLLPEGSELRLT